MTRANYSLYRSLMECLSNEIEECTKAQGMKDKERMYLARQERGRIERAINTIERTVEVATDRKTPDLLKAKAIDELVSRYSNGIKHIIEKYGQYNGMTSWICRTYGSIFNSGMKSTNLPDLGFSSGKYSDELELEIISRQPMMDIALMTYRDAVNVQSIALPDDVTLKPASYYRLPTPGQIGPYVNGNGHNGNGQSGHLALPNKKIILSRKL